MDADTGTLLARQQPYIFQPLHPRRPQTRLLTLEAGGDGDALVGSLSVCAVGHRMPQYKAISYCWGDVSSRDFDVCLDGRLLAVTSNAHQALANCRDAKRRKVFWMDQVCINQEDVEERSRHIAYMAHIYGQAGSVIAYLGGDYEGFDELFSLLQVLGSDPYQRGWWWFLRSRMETLATGSPLLSLFGPGEVLPRKKISRLKQFEDQVGIIRTAFEVLLAAAWFKRIWIIQEATMPRKLYVRCGNRVASWEAFKLLTNRWAYLERYELPTLSTVMGFKSACAIALLRNLRPGRRMSLKTTVDHFRWRLKHEQELSLLQLIAQSWRNLTRTNHPSILCLLRQFRHQLATDERDKVFGLLGLASPQEVRSYLGANSKNANYFSNITILCFHFAVWHILETKTLDVLMGACYGSKMHASLPYWVPDWSHEAAMCETVYAFEPFSIPPYKAGTRRPANPNFIPSCMALILEGFVIDVVVSVVDETINVHKFNQPSAAVWSKWKEFAIEFRGGDPYETPAGRYDAYWRTLVYDTEGGSRRASPALGERLTAWAEGKVDPKSTEVTGRLVFRERRLFRTKRGCLGNGCATVQPGDKVCVCFGGRLPLLLRESKEVKGLTSNGSDGDERQEETFMGHLLVGGDSYVHGLCDGQAFTIAEKEGLSAEKLCLI